MTKHQHKTFPIFAHGADNIAQRHLNGQQIILHIFYFYCFRLYYSI
jgi:hypothetical protein